MTGRIRRRAAYGVGAALIITGFTGLLLEADRTDPLGWALWFGGLIVAHDALVVPLVLLAGAATAWLREPFLSPVRAALVTAGILCLVALPAVLGIGRRADNPSLLPLDYGRNLAAVLAVIALAAACAMVVSRLRARRRLRRGEHGPQAGPPRRPGAAGTPRSPHWPATPESPGKHSHAGNRDVIPPPAGAEENDGGQRAFIPLVSSSDNDRPAVR
ncbi:hypothetical protein OG339_20900 [Streptosporangium sp. NBC_01495]|uniref:hypothetical protein n=1 Tax=Streptosporangium sp. NBC_01495 TaxID=2903899 RepID=UPI002E30E0E4|nr:hypothetical protein [Streptosporangium sp. NBC_01495]